jgi:peptidoglycan/LPS O-acetylase OafA/YrhL
VQAQTAAGQWRRRALLASVAALAAALGFGLAGVALLLLAAVPLQAMPLPWLLVLVPVLPLALAAACALRLQQLDEPSALAPLRDQLAADAALLREASGS